MNTITILEFPCLPPRLLIFTEGTHNRNEVSSDGKAAIPRGYFMETLRIFNEGFMGLFGDAGIL
jgi:hypothetical protein